MAPRSLLRDVLQAALIVWLLFILSALHTTGVHSVDHVFLVSGACAAIVAPVAAITGLVFAGFFRLRRDRDR